MASADQGRPALGRQGRGDVALGVLLLESARLAVDALELLARGIVNVWHAGGPNALGNVDRNPERDFFFVNNFASFVFMWAHGLFAPSKVLEEQPDGVVVPFVQEREDLRAREESFVGRALLRGARGGELNAPAMPLFQMAVALRVVRVAQEPWTRFDRTLQEARVIRSTDWFFHGMIMNMKVPAGVTFSPAEASPAEKIGAGAGQAHVPRVRRAKHRCVSHAKTARDGLQRVECDGMAHDHVGRVLSVEAVEAD